MASIDPLADPLEESITNQSWCTTHQYFKDDMDIFGCLEFSLAAHAWPFCKYFLHLMMHLFDLLLDPQ